MAASTSAADIGYPEDFALARDRAAALKLLIPGTEDHFYYHALHYLNTEQFDKAAALLPGWIEKFGRTPRVIEIETRHALLTYEQQPKKSLDFLRGRLSLTFDHQRQSADGPPDLPTIFDVALLARERLKADALARHANLDGFEDAALDWLATNKLDDERRRNLLQRLRRPDVPALAKLVADDLAYRNSQGFGAFPIHGQMTRAQLDELLGLRPTLLNETNFINLYLTKLQPTADDDWRHNPDKLAAYLDRLLAFVRRLDPVHNSLKAHVLYHRLAFDRSRGQFDKALFIEYLKLPRRQGYMAAKLNESDQSQRFPANLGQDFTAGTLMPPIGVDEPLVRSFLKQFLVNADSPKEFLPFIDDVYLKYLFAETKIEAGVGETDRWAADLPPDLYRQIKERIDIDFAPTNRTLFKAAEPVTLDLHIKNVPTLIVKVFEINVGSFYRERKQEVDTDINLDGLIANSEQTFTYSEASERRMPRRFDFPQLDKPGVYVIDFIGAGKSSRALVRKGKLHPLVATGASGQVVTVVDDADQSVPDATLWLGGTEYKPGKDGKILVPFSTSPGRQPIVLTKGDFSSLDYLDHQPENYTLAAGIHVEREQLLTQRLATIVLRPAIYLNGVPQSVSLLEEGRLRITATDQDGVSTSTEIPGVRLFEDRETTHEVRVPPRLALLTVVLTAKVKSLSAGKPVDVAADRSFSLNGIATTDKIEDLHLARFADGYAVELLGRSGEPKADRAVSLTLKHRDYRELVRVTLKTDARGRVVLGQLPNISHVAAMGPEGTAHNWPLLADRSTIRPLLHARIGEVIAVPVTVAGAKPTREEFALFELAGEAVRADRFENLAAADGALTLTGLPAGDYDLHLKASGEKVRLRVVDGPVVGGHVLGKVRHLQLPGLKPVQIAAITPAADDIRIQLKDASTFARVHVFATRYVPAFDPFTDLAGVRDAGLGGVYPGHADSAYLTGRNIGDEYRYVLDRKYQKKFPGSLLERPQLLLNPWAVRTTETSEQLAQLGAEFGGAGVPKPASPAPTMADPLGRARSKDVSVTSVLDFLADSAAVVLNLTPDKDGVVTVPRKLIGPHALLHVVAVDPLHTAVRTVALPEMEMPAATLDLRLKAGLDPKGHFTQQKQVSVLPAGQAFVLADAAGGRFESYDSLPRVFALYATLSRDPKLTEFAFVLTWPTLKPEEKRAKYSQYACHELNLFLASKDRDFFAAVVKPYLANKKDKTFLDHYLLGDDVAEYAKPWKYSRLNAVERVLLAKRLPGEPAKTARHLNDLLKLLPPNADRSRLLFETALLGSGLEKAGKGAAADMEKFNLRAMNEAERTPILPPVANQPMAPGAAPADAPMGGGRGGEAGERRKEAKDQLSDRDGAAREMKELNKNLGDSAEKKSSADKMKRDAGKDANNEFFMNRLSLPANRPLYRKLDVTQEWAENNYYHLPIQAQVAELVSVSPFWAEYAAADGKTPFLSRHFADASRNFTEMMLALAVLDLPFEAAKADAKFDAGKLTYTPGGAAIAVHEEVRAAAAPDGAVPVLVSQNFYRPADRYREENGERLDKFVTGEFVIQTVYGCQVVVTNPSPSRQKLSVLIQLPVGAVQVGGGKLTRSVPLDLEPYRTQTIDYLFYFPRPGTFAQFPVHVAKGEKAVAAATPTTFTVVEKPTKLDTESWDYVSQNGTPEQVLAFLARENVFAMNLERIAFRMGDSQFFEKVIALLADRHAYQHTLWSYAIKHANIAAAREFLQHADQIAQEVGGPIDSPLVTYDPVIRHNYEHLEYKPLVNARAHALGQRRQIVNARVHAQYHQFLRQISYRRDLTDDARLAAAYYLLLQDRVDEAAEQFGKVNPERVATRLQYDYMAAHLGLVTEDVKAARAMAIKHANHPVDRWRQAFAAVATVLDEVEGKGPKVVDPADRGQAQTQLAATAPGFEFTIENKEIRLTWQNLETVRVNYYLMDVELLFSRNPFVQQTGGQFTAIRPNRTQEVKLPAGTKHAVPLPAELVGRNVLVEVTAAGKTRTAAYYANAMEVTVTEGYGQVRVRSAAGKPLAKVYVKTYVRTADGQVKFHRDGYTDLRGRFDYATVSTPESSPPAKFSILVLSEEAGAVIREADPPQR